MRLFRNALCAVALASPALLFTACGDDDYGAERPGADMAVPDASSEAGAPDATIVHDLSILSDMIDASAVPPDLVVTPDLATPPIDLAPGQ